MKTRLKRWLALLLIVAVALAGAGCGKAKHTAAASPTPAPERPEVTPSPEKVCPPEVERFAGYTINLKPARGPMVIIQEPVAAQLIMDAYSTDRLQVQDAIGKFNNKLEVLDPEGKARYSFNVASDGQLLMKASDGKVFRMPEYVYYLIEDQLWTYNGSLIDSNLKWDPEKGTSQLELELPRYLKAGMLPAFGYASAYFTNYTLYGVNTETRNTAKIYLLLTCAGYEISGNSFAPRFLYTTPATLIFTKAGDGWQLTGLKQPPNLKEKKGKDLYNSVRTIFPYDYMEDVLEDLNKVSKEKGNSPQIKDIVRQATEYLNTVRITGLTVES